MKKQKLLNTKLVDRINIPTIPVLIQLQGDETITDVNVLDGYVFDAKSIQQAIKDLEFEHNNFSKKYPYLFDDSIKIINGRDSISINGSRIVLGGIGISKTIISNTYFRIILDKYFSRIIRDNSTEQKYSGKGTITSYTDQNDTYIKVQELSNSLTIDEKGISISGKTNEDLLNANGGTISIPELKVQLNLSDYLTKTEYNNEKLIVNGKLYLDTLPEGEDIVSYINNKTINYEFIMTDNAHNLQVIQQLNESNKLDAIPVYLVYADGTKDICNFTNGHIDIVSNGFLYEYNVNYNTGEIVLINRVDIIHSLAYYHLEIGNSDAVKASNMEYLTGHQGQFFCEIDYGYGVGIWHAVTGGQATIMTAYGDYVQYIISGDGVVTRAEDSVAGFDIHTKELNMTVANISIGTAVTDELATVIEKTSSICGIPGFNSPYTRFLRQDGAGDIIKFSGFMTHASDNSTIINTIKYNKTTKTFTY